MEKTDDPEILHSRQMEKGTKPNWYDTPVKVGNLFSHHRDDIDFQLLYGTTFL